MKNQAKIFQTKEEDELPETDSIEIELYGFTWQIIQNNSHSDAHWDQETMHEQSKNFNKEIENILKSTKQKSCRRRT